ncbi:hypothetical protein ANTRET_LOCUS11052 [Anthophora retusa]
MAESFAIQQAVASIPQFDGNNNNIPLKDFLLDVQNSAYCLPPTCDGSFTKAVLPKLRGEARDSICDLQFPTINDLIRHLRRRFPSGRTYEYYQQEISNIRMKINESVYAFYDRLRILISGLYHCLKDTYGDDASNMLRPVKSTAINAFMRGLPDELASAVEARDPDDLEKALEVAIKYTYKFHRYQITPNQENVELKARSSSPNRNISSQFSTSPKPNLGKSATFKLTTSSSCRRDDELQTSRASTDGKILGRERTLFAIEMKRDSPVVEMSAEELRSGTAHFLVDTGAEINIIKLKSLDENVRVSLDDSAGF